MSRYIDAEPLEKRSPKLRALILEQPTADVEPVRHGHWIAVTVSSGRDSWQCSECGRHARGKIENLPYCHCGAKMDGESND